MRNAARTSSRTATAPLPSALAGRGFEPHDMRLGEPELRSLLDGDDPLGGVDRGEQCVQQRGLPGSGAARDHDVGAAAHEPVQERRHVGSDAEGVEIEPARAESPDGDAGSVDGERWDDRVEAGAVGETGVDHGRRTVEPERERSEDPLGDAEYPRLVEVQRDGLDAPRRAPRSTDRAR